jgi:template-activating factor I
MSNSKKRSSPGADTTKNGDPFTDVDIGDAEESILAEYQKKIQRVELILGEPVPLYPYDHMSALSHKSLAERRAQEQLTPVYQQRREALKSIPKFWPVALLKHSLFALQALHDADRLALSYLEDVWVVRDPREPKVFTLEFVRPVVITEIQRYADTAAFSILRKIPISAIRC